MDEVPNRVSTRLKGWDYSSDGYYFITICTQNREHYFGEIKNKNMDLSEIGRMAAKFWREIPQRYKIVELDEFIVMPNHIHGILIINNQILDVDGAGAGAHHGMSITPQFNKKIPQNSNHRPGWVGEDADVGTDDTGAGSGVGSNADADVGAGSGVVDVGSDAGADVGAGAGVFVGARRGVPLQIHGVSLQNGVPLQIQKSTTKLNQFSKPIPNSISMIINHFKGDLTKFCRKNNFDFVWQRSFHDHIIRNKKELNNIRDYISKNPLHYDKDKNNMGLLI